MWKTEAESDKEIGDESRGWYNAIAGFEEGRGPRNKECGSLQKLEKAKNRFPSRASRKGHSPGDTLNLAH